MLTGAIPLVPPGHHLEHLIEHGKSGYICNDFLEYQEHAQRLSRDYGERQKIARRCRKHAEGKICSAPDHLKVWKEVFK